MKTLLFYLSLLLFVNITLSQTPTENGPSIVFDELNHDYGVIDSASNGVHIFKFKNEGTQDLIISEVKSSCGCTVPEWTNIPIVPGQTGSIKVSYNTTKIGPINKSILVITNAKNEENGVVNLRIKGEVIRKKN